MSNFSGYWFGSLNLGNEQVKTYQNMSDQLYYLQVHFEHIQRICKAAIQRCRRRTELQNNKWTSILYKSSGKVLKVWNKHTVLLLPLNIIYISQNQFFNISVLGIQLKYIITTRSCLDLYKEIEPLTESTIFRCDISQKTGSLASTKHI